MTIELPDDVGAALHAKALEQGISESELIKHALRLLNERAENEPLGDDEEAEAMDDEAKIAWLQAAAKEGFDAIDRGDSVTLTSPEEIAAFLVQVHDEVRAEVAAEPRRG